MSGSDLRARLGPIGIWSMELRYSDPGAGAEAAAEIEELGFGGLWVPGGIEPGVLPVMENLAAATQSLVIASGIINVWMDTAADVAAWWKRLPESSRKRLLLGLGVSHAAVVGDAYARVKPLTVMRAYLDELAEQGVPPENLCLAALAPRMLELARDRTLGTHPYVVPVAHTALARAAVGPDRLVAPELGVILEADADKARALGRATLGPYSQLPNYLNNWRRSGFSEEDIAGLSDRLIDGIFAWGTLDQIGRRIREHHEAGANHVCLQIIRAPMKTDFTGFDPAETIRAMGAALDTLRADCRLLAQVLL